MAIFGKNDCPEVEFKGMLLSRRRPTGTLSQREPLRINQFTQPKGTFGSTSPKSQPRLGERSVKHEWMFRNDRWAPATASLHFYTAPWRASSLAQKTSCK